MDERHAKFLAALYQKRASFQVLYSCHQDGAVDGGDSTTGAVPSFKCPFTNVESDSLRGLFHRSAHPLMRSVVECLPAEKTIDLPRLNQLIRDPRHATFVVAEGQVKDPAKRTIAHQMGYILTKDSKHHLLSAHQTSRPSLFSNHMLCFLQDQLDFQITKVYHVIVTGVSDAFQPLFKKICEERTRQKANGLVAEAALIKFLACTFVGLTQSFNWARAYVSVRNAEKAISTKSKQSTYEFRPIFGTRWVTVKRRARVRPKSLSPAIGMAAIFYSKTRLLQSILFIERTCAADAFRLLNISTDSLTWAIAEDTLRECVVSTELDYFDNHVRDFIRDPPEPGFLKMESRYTGEWLIQLHGARTYKVTVENVQEKKRAESSLFPLNLTLYRHIYCSYVYNDRVLWWSVPFGAVE